MIFALIPAAGDSRRMGQPKLSLPLGDRTVLGHVIQALRQAGLEHILVVVGAHVPELVLLAEAAGAATVLLEERTADMRATIQRGLSWLQTRFQPHDDDLWLLVPADHPSINPAVVAELIRAHAQNRRCSIFVPTFQEQRGHPALLSWKHVAGINGLPPNHGLNVYLRQHTQVTCEVAVDSADILVDLDTPEDYENLRRVWRHRSSSP